MKVVEESPTRLVLAGIPGGALWMVALTLFGAVATGIVVTIIVNTVLSVGWAWRLIPMGVGLLIGLGLLATGAVTLAIGRERLEFDLDTGRGMYDVRSPVIDKPKPFEFDLARVHAVAIERSVETHPGGPDRAEPSEVRVMKARLQLVKPRRAVVLDETQNGREARVRRIAERVAAFLAMEVIERGRGLSRRGAAKG